MGDLIRPIPNSIIDVRKSLSKDLMTRYRDSLTLIEALIKSAPLMEGAVDSVSAGTITDTNPTYGSIQHNDQFNGLELHFTSGAVYTANNHNRYKITATNFTNKTITVAENLVTAGVVATDTYEILGHSHDGTATGGARIDLKNLANILRGQLMTQDLADAITDPNNVRGGVANATFPFLTSTAVILNCKAITHSVSGNGFTFTLNHNLNRTVNYIKTRVISSEGGSSGFLGDHSAVWFPDLTAHVVGKRKQPNTAAEWQRGVSAPTNGGIANAHNATLNGTSDIRITSATNTQLTVLHANGGSSHGYSFLFEVH